MVIGSNNVEAIKVGQYISYYWLDIVEFIIVRLSVCSHDIYQDYNDKYNYNGRMILRVTLYEYIHNTYLDRIEYSLGS